MVSTFGLVVLVGSCAGAGSAPNGPADVDAGSEVEQPTNAAPTESVQAAPTPGLKLLSHRGVHHTFDPEGVDDQTCTATRIDPPTHQYIENTLPSIEAAFTAGAHVVEIDIAPTVDGVLAVFHDADVGCRTNGQGRVRSRTWSELSELDVGYGYTADGETYPLRGHGVGLMPRLEEVFGAFPDGKFLVNFKNDNETDAALLRQVVEAEEASGQVWAVSGGAAVVDTYLSLTGARGFSEASIRKCLGEYVATADGDPFPRACDERVTAPNGQ